MGYSGGGATDIRLKPGDSDELESLLSRIIVAAGGGGTGRCNEYSDSTIVNTSDNSNAGGLVGSKGEIRWNQDYQFAITNAEGGAQTREGVNGNCISSCTNKYPHPSNGKLGIGGNAKDKWGSGGGGGYFGGGAGYVQDGIIGGGGGGSSFVSGCEGCIALSENSNFNNIIPLGSNIHYSKKVFNNIVMKSGNEEFLSPKGTIENGHFGNGAIKITFLSFSSCIFQKTQIQISIQFLVLILLFK